MISPAIRIVRMKGKQKSYRLELGMTAFVAVVVLGVTINAVNMLRKDLNLENTTQQLSTSLRLAQEEANFEHAEFGFAIDDKGYAFYRRDSAQEAWQRITDDSLFPQQHLPAHKDLQLLVDGKLAQLQQDEPQIIMQPGELQNFSLQFIDENNNEYSIISDENGEVTWVATVN